MMVGSIDIWLMRHPAPAVPAGVCYGQTDVGLVPGWEKQLAGHAEILGSCRLIISSPLRRCLQPAQWLSEKLDCSLVLDTRLMEMNFGAWEGRRWQAVDGPQARAWADDFVGQATPGGESYEDLACRVGWALQETRQRPGPVLWLSHGGPIRAAMAMIKGEPLQKSFDWEVPFLEPRRMSS